MRKLEELKRQVNQAYSAALNCSCYKQKRNLLEKFYEANKRYNQHKSWVSTLSASSY